MITRISSGGPWEESIGYSRAVVVDRWVLTSGCTSTVDGQVAHVDDPYGQTLEAFGIALRAVAEAGAGVEHVVRTRMYVTDIGLLDEVGRAHGSLFGEVRPAATMVGVSGLAHPDHLVEVEVEAFLPVEAGP
jgi:enamine deaminase RidA (YjgF/YER057c/UK114 family)